MDKQREAFEAWWFNGDYSPSPHKRMSIYDEDAFEIWQTAQQELQVNQQAQWLPIETAPMDETVVLAYAKTYMGISFISSMFFIDDDWYLFDTGELPDVQPSHWMPLPPEPKP